MLTQAILIGLIAAFGKFDCQLGTLYAFRPIVLCPLVGLVTVVGYLVVQLARSRIHPNRCESGAAVHGLDFHRRLRAA